MKLDEMRSLWTAAFIADLSTAECTVAIGKNIFEKIKIKKLSFQEQKIEYRLAQEEKSIFFKDINYLCLRYVFSAATNLPAFNPLQKPQLANFWLKEGMQLQLDCYLSFFDYQTGIYLCRTTENKHELWFFPYSSLVNYNFRQLPWVNLANNSLESKSELNHDVVHYEGFLQFFHDHYAEDDTALQKFLEQFIFLGTGDKQEENLITLKLSHWLEQKVLHPDEKFQIFLDHLDVNEQEILNIFNAQRLGICFVRLHHLTISNEALTYISDTLANKYHFMPLQFYRHYLVVAMDNPFNNEVVNVLNFLTGRPVKVVMATRADIDWAINEYYFNRANNELIEQFNKSLETGNTDKKQKSDDQLLEEISNASHPIVFFVSRILEDAIKKGASDVHFKPALDHLEIVYRLDGQLKLIRKVTRSAIPALISRLKILSGMDIAEHRLPQDGQAHSTFANRRVDMRFSCLPTVYGESMVVRILDAKNLFKDFEKIGFTVKDAEQMLRLLDYSSGMILVTGPTGSGKSTTLYTALNYVISQNRNLITVEDPVEYAITGLQQIQVNNKVGLSFSRVLRNMLRHDPDALMVGEIRDAETAKIAIESALTGHLLLSSLHTKSAISTVNRLLEMGVERYLINASLLAVISQRLARKNCSSCLQAETAPAYIYDVLTISKNFSSYAGIGCKKCQFSGFQGRMMVYELLVINDVVRQSIEEKLSEKQIEEKVKLLGFQDIVSRSLALAKDKQLSLQEVYRVCLR